MSTETAVEQQDELEAAPVSCAGEKVGEEVYPCFVKLTRDEKIEYGKRLATHQVNIEDAQDEKKQIAARIKALEGERSRLALVIEQEQEKRPVDCDLMVAGDGRVLYVRSDTGEIAHDREMLPSERQRTLELVVDDGAADQTEGDDDTSE